MGRGAPAGPHEVSQRNPSRRDSGAGHLADDLDSPKLEGVKTSDLDNRIVAFVSALTLQPKAIIESLDTEDYDVCQGIAIFFL